MAPIAQDADDAKAAKIPINSNDTAVAHWPSHGFAYGEVVGTVATRATPY
jgi:hypothetical protein